MASAGSMNQMGYSPSSSPGATGSGSGFRAWVARRTLGIMLLMVTVFLWTVSNFLASVR